MGTLLPAWIRPHLRSVSMLVSSLLVNRVAKGGVAPWRPLHRAFDAFDVTRALGLGRPGGPAMVAEFRGPSPHDLGTAELATARFVDESVEVSLHLLDDWHRPMGPIIQVRMTPEVARSLAERLTAAAEART